VNGGTPQLLFVRRKLCAGGGKLMADYSAKETGSCQREGVPCGKSTEVLRDLYFSCRKKNRPRYGATYTF